MARLLGYSGSIMSDHLLVDPIDPIALTRQLVEIESTTYNEGAVGDFLAGFLAGRGWVVEKTPVEQPTESVTGAARWNVYAGIADQRPDLVFSTHMDTVPPYVPYSEDAEFMYGRGVSDAKGIIAAQVAAAEALRAAGFKVGMLFVSGEERDSAGAKAANLAPRGSKFLINGEPTDNRIALASKGALRVSLKAKGKMAHSAYPELGDSAVHKLVEVLDRLLKLKLPVDEYAGDTTLNIGQIQGGHAPNVRLGSGARRGPGSGEGAVRGCVHAGPGICAAARGGRAADDGGEVCDGHSSTDELGGAGSAGAGVDSRGAYAD